MLMDLVHVGGVEFRGFTLRGKIFAALSGSYLLLALLLVFHAYSEHIPQLRIAGALVLAIGGLVAWLGALRRYRIIADTPTAMLRSAAQGYVELTGTCRGVPDSELLQFRRVPPCLWYLAAITEHRYSWGRNRSDTRYERSEDTFLIDDGTGECVIDPEHAEVQSAHKTSWREGNTYYKVSYLVPGDRIYALGDMHTLRAADGTLDRRADVSALLREWKQDRPALVRRFDTDGDGDVDLQEWQHAVTAAQRQVDAQHREMRLEPGIHVMRAPTDGRPFLLSNRDPDELRRRFRSWAWFHLAMFVGGTVWALMLVIGAR